MIHYNQLINNKLSYNEGFEGKKTGYRAKSFYNLHILKSP